MSRPGLELSFLVVCTVQYILFLYTLAQPGSRHLSSANINVKLQYQRATISVQLSTCNHVLQLSPQAVC